MARRIKLTRYGLGQANYLYLSAHRLRVVASDAEDMDHRIFVYRRLPLDPHTGEVRDEFMTIASPVDMEEYPADEPDQQRAFPFFRKDTVEIDLRATATAEEVWSIIKAECCILVDALNRLEELKELETVWCPGPPSDDSDDSDQSTSSAPSASSDSSASG